MINKIFFKKIILIIFLLLISGCNSIEAKPSMYFANSQHTNNYKTKGVSSYNGVKWKFQSDDELINSPVISDGMVFIGTHYFLHVFDSKNGVEKWKFKIELASTPLVMDNRVFVGGTDGYLFALDKKDGKEIWKFKAINDFLTSPVMGNGTIYIGSHVPEGNEAGYLYAIDMYNGQEKWRFKTEGNSRISITSPAFDNNLVYIGCSDGILYAIDSYTGNIKWKFKTTEGFSTTEPVINQGIIYFGSTMKGDYLYALDSKTGNVKWKFKPDVQLGSSPALDEQSIYFKDGEYLRSLDNKTGKEKWKLKISNKINYTEAPAIADGLIFIGSEDGYLHAINANKGIETWRFKTQKEIYFVPAISDGVVYVGSFDGNLYAIY